MEIKKLERPILDNNYTYYLYKLVLYYRAKFFHNIVFNNKLFHIFYYKDPYEILYKIRNYIFCYAHSAYYSREIAFKRFPFWYKTFVYNKWFISLRTLGCILLKFIESFDSILGLLSTFYLFHYFIHTIFTYVVLFQAYKDKAKKN